MPLPKKLDIGITCIMHSIKKSHMKLFKETRLIKNE